jgi:hypothetical protein
MTNRPNVVYILILLWLALSLILALWGAYSFWIVLQIPGWANEIPTLAPILHFGYLMSTIVWIVFAGIFIIFSYGTLKKDHWVWTTGLIISTIFLAIFALMLASFMVNALIFMDTFSIMGLVSVILSFLTNLGIVFYLTRPSIKTYFELEDTKIIK